MRNRVDLRRFTMLASVPVERIDLGISTTDLDLSMIRMKLMDTEEGKGWSERHACRVETEYRRYLGLCRRYPSQAIVPSKEVDTVWHYHILDTQAYAADCERVFGYFLHHFPYFGMRGPDDATALLNAYNETLELYEFHFGPSPADLWPQAGMSRCPNCGRR
jgi:hypothetical protein